MSKKQRSLMEIFAEHAAAQNEGKLEQYVFHRLYGFGVISWRQGGEIVWRDLAENKRHTHSKHEVIWMGDLSNPKMRIGLRAYIEEKGWPVPDVVRPSLLEETWQRTE